LLPTEGQPEEDAVVVVTKSQELRRTLPALVAGFTVAIVFGAVLSIVLTAAGPDGMGLSDRQTSGWIALIYGLPMLPSLVLTFRYHVPLLLTGNVFALIFFASLGNRITFPELAGAAMVAGAIVLVTALLGLTGRLAAFIPTPIVQALIAGALMPFVVGVFSSLSTSDDTGRIPVEIPIMVGAAVLAYLASERVLGTRVPPILPAFLVGLLVATLTGQLGPFPSLFALPGLEVVNPKFTWTAIATVTPVLVALMTVQANVPSVIYLRTQGYHPPERLLNVISGAGTMLGSLFGAITISLALPPLLLTAGPAAGDRSIRHRSVYVPVVAGLLIAIFAGTAADLAMLVPPVLLLTMAGLALIPALTIALREITGGPLVLGPLFAFAIALSHMSVLALGPFFWSLVVGTLISLVFEREGWRELMGETDPDQEHG
jgi:benzoate membrane transport protein